MRTTASPSIHNDTVANINSTLTLQAQRVQKSAFKRYRSLALQYSSQQQAAGWTCSGNHIHWPIAG